MADIVVITGLSGAGRTNAAADLEDQGWYVVDNLPTSLVRTIVDLASVPGSAIERLALVVGTSPHQADILDAIDGLRQSGHRVRIVYLEATTPELVKRYGSTRRRHPLGEDTSLLDAIDRERELLEPVKAMADVVIDTTGLTIHQLKSRLTELFAVDAPASRDADGGRLVRLQARPPARRRHRARLPVPAQPVLGGGAAAAHRPRRTRPDVRPRAAGGRPVHRPRGRPPRAAGAGVREGGQELPDDRLRLHRRAAPQRHGGRGGGGPPAAARASSSGCSTATCPSRVRSAHAAPRRSGQRKDGR